MLLFSNLNSHTWKPQNLENNRWFAIVNAGTAKKIDVYNKENFSRLAVKTSSSFRGGFVTVVKTFFKQSRYVS